MVLEVVQVQITPGMEADFEDGVRTATAVFQRAKGCKGVELQRCIEDASRYFLFVQWQTLENHTEDFRNSEDFKVWRGLVGHCFAAPPNVIHANVAVKGF